jgi:hypothetical protein
MLGAGGEKALTTGGKVRRGSKSCRFGIVFAVILPVSCALGQASPSASSPTSTLPSTSASAVTKPVDLKPDSTGAVPPEQIRELLRRAEEKDLENDKQQRDYTYIERVEQHKLDGRGGVKQVESRTSEVLEIYGDPVTRLTAKDDKLLPPDEAKKEEEKIQKIIDKRKNESEDDRRKRLTREGYKDYGGRRRESQVVDGDWCCSVSDSVSRFRTKILFARIASCAYLSVNKPPASATVWYGT